MSGRKVECEFGMGRELLVLSAVTRSEVTCQSNSFLPPKPIDFEHPRQRPNLNSGLICPRGKTD